MITLYLNDKPAVLDENQTIKFIREDVYFTKSGTYTYEITLPARNPLNIGIFGHIYRKEKSKFANMTYSARLDVDNLNVLNGTATITNITDTSVKLQLIGGNAEFNFYTKNEKKYIDELELGTWYDVDGVCSADLTMNSMAKRISENFNNEINTIGLDAAYKNLCRKLWNENTKDAPTDWVALPCINENYDVICNNFGIRKYETIGVEGWYEYRYYTIINDLNTVNLSAQPYLVPMIERVFSALGYPVETNCLRENVFFMKLVIVTANNRSAIARALPHWTVTEFIKEIENLFAVVIQINEVTRKTSIKSRSDFFRDNIEFIDNIVDEYSVTMETDNTIDIANANIGYSEVSEYDRIDDDISEKGEIDKRFDNTDFTKGLQNLVDTIYNAYTGNYNTWDEYKGKIFKICDRSIIIEIYDHIDQNENIYKNHVRTIFIDEFANRVNVEGKKDLDIELKICPSKTTKDGSVAFYNEYGVFSGTNTCFHLIKADNTDPAGIENETNAYIAGLISGESAMVETKEDLMSICLYDGGFVKYDFVTPGGEYFRSFLTQTAYPGTQINCVYPAGYLMYQWQANTYTGGGTIQKFANESLSLNIDSFTQTINGKEYTYRTFYSEVFKHLKRIDTQVKYCFKFIANRQLPIDTTFIIRGQKFVCEKMEYTIKGSGFEKLVTGYFYRLEE